MNIPDVKINPSTERLVAGAGGEVRVYEVPEEVHDLKKLPMSKRSAAAARLAEQGAIIDVPVDVWGWDAKKTIAYRRIYGYTWTPSALMDSVKVAPGLIFPGLPSYKAEEIPAGAIVVPPLGSLVGE